MPDLSQNQAVRRLALKRLVDYAGATRLMQHAQPVGDCNTCYTEAGTDASLSRRRTSVRLRIAEWGGFGAIS